MDTEDDDLARSESPAKKQRCFVARQACDACRRKKTRCDEDIPCSLCKSQGIECHYSERKITKHEASYSSILQSLSRVERKIDSLRANQSSERSKSSDRTVEQTLDRSRNPSTLIALHNPAIDLQDSSPAVSPSSRPGNYPTPNPKEEQPLTLSFSAHLTLAWPGIVNLLPESVHDICKDVGLGYASSMEFCRPSLPILGGVNTTDWISQLSLGVFKELSYSYFRNFNTTFPILDQDVYFQRTLPAAMNCDFGVNIDTCTVLLVMALGSWGIDERRGLSNAASPVGSTRHRGNFDWTNQTDSIPGLAYLNEARRRMAFFDTDVGLQSCQIYLLASLFYAQAMRPGQWWMMANRASFCSSLFWKEDKAGSGRETPSRHSDSWERDMHSRLFWICVMFETLLADELDVPNTSLLHHCEYVPLPKFVAPTFLSTPSTPNCSSTDDAFFHYHFLSQIAHRILLTRIRDSLFISSQTNRYPTSTLEQELYHQLEQWKDQLPSDLAFDLQKPMQISGSPHILAVTAWLRARYIISRYHIRRPLMHRAFMNPASLTDTDIAKCGGTLSSIVEWTAIMEHVFAAGPCVPYRYFIYSQLFGQMVVVYGLSASPDRRLRRLIQREHCEWYRRALELIAVGAGQSEIIAKDYLIATLLYQKITVTSV
ncbi:Hypothetical protein R9X50_00347600 [Acrodontium crateriforme]|uniref:Zn(2)-C6 fungal-type domain-containing protein n=1 Tax=Acrodontium crateriforme TaxID=150365 RepID=A0AAQ3R9F7_9PEZI|nr:Hypothetical protein R9X50_00347600 [Acrodontium crateriforme]